MKTRIALCVLVVVLCACGARDVERDNVLPTVIFVTNVPTVEILPVPTAGILDQDVEGAVIVHVTVLSLNVRSGPGTDHPVVSGLSLNDAVTVIGRNADGSWLQIVRGNGTDWIAAEFTDVDNVMELPEVE